MECRSESVNTILMKFLNNICEYTFINAYHNTYFRNILVVKATLESQKYSKGGSWINNKG